MALPFWTQALHDCLFKICLNMLRLKYDTQGKKLTWTLTPDGADLFLNGQFSCQVTYEEIQAWEYEVRQHSEGS